jgi:CubicO group peptidase (beta-lactamase class C family)
VPCPSALAALLLAAAPLATSPPVTCPVLPAWPDTDWSVAAPPAEPARRGAVEALERYAFPPRAPGRKGIRTDGLVIARGGVIVHERYAEGYGPASPHVAWSCTKSLTSALAGVALARGTLGLDDSICRHLSQPAPQLDFTVGQLEQLRPHCDVSVRHLLQLASGLDWNESYEGMNLQGSSVLAMLYGVGRADMAGFVRSHPSVAPPGTRWNYSSGDSVLLSAVVRSALEPSLGKDWPGAALFEPLGMRSATLERDAAGTPVGSSFLHATPRDLARFGLLYLADGCWQGRRILPEGYVAASTAVSAPSRSPAAHRQAGDVYGLGWWLNRPVAELGQPAPWPGVPEDAFAARGHWGQLVAVIPSLGLVVVRTGDDREQGAFDVARFLALAVAAGRGP